MYCRDNIWELLSYKMHIIQDFNSRQFNRQNVQACPFTTVIAGSFMLIYHDVPGSQVNMDIHLTHTEIQNFSGSYTYWPPFKDIFVTIVEENKYFSTYYKIFNQK